MNEEYKIYYNDTEANARNGGVVNTPVRSNISFLNPTFSIYFDYLSFSFPCGLSSATRQGSFKDMAMLAELLKVLKLDPSRADEKKGRYNYSRSLSWTALSDKSKKDVTTDLMYGNDEVDSNGCVLTADRYGRLTTMLEMSGGACRDFESRNGYNLECWKDLDRVINDIEGKITKFDLAIDIYDSPLNIPQYLYEKYINGELVTPCKKSTYEHNPNRDNLAGGATLYIGSKKSDFYCRIYDKKAENLAKGVKDFSFNHYRIEFSARHERAVNLYSDTFENWRSGTLLDFVKTLILKYIQPKESGPYTSNIRTRKVDSRWYELFCGMRKNVTMAIKGSNDIEIKANWFIRSCSRILAMLYISMDSHFNVYLRQVFAYGFGNLKDFSQKDLDLINDYRKSRSLSTFTASELAYIIKELERGDHE